mmetsp:Transcript_3622/g.3985  ORF Transcript_3622/g.3985 Transcript_3622/m.3985 type:complete len:545 (+) Transcript_3622:41-1675(+)
MLNKESKMNVPNFESHEETESWKLGIKLQFLVSWSKEQGFTPSTTTREVCANFIKPATQVTQLSYCEHLLQSEDTAEFVGFPSAFISHAWDDHFPEVLEALTSYFTAEPDVVIWFDIFCNNQHQTASFHFGWWCDGFKKAIHSFGRTVMVLAPWNDPLPLQRGWCIWELYCTILGKRSDGKCKFDVAMSPASIEQFIADVDADPVNVMDKMLSTIDTEKSDCSEKADKERIHDAIERTVGFNELNKAIFDIMRGWVISKYEGKYRLLDARCDSQILLRENHPDTFIWKNNLAILYQNQGEYRKALTLYEECLITHPDNLSVINNLATLYINQGERQKALPLFEESLRLRIVGSGEDHPNTLSATSNLANLYDDVGEYGKALPLFETCLKMRKVKLGEDHADTLSSMNNLANVYDNQGESEKALSLYEECLLKTQKLLGDTHPDALSCMNNVANSYKRRGDFQKALQLYEVCLEKRKTVSGDDHPDTLTAMSNLASLYKSQGEYKKAVLLFEECSRKQKVVLGENHPQTLKSMRNLADLYILQNL